MSKPNTEFSTAPKPESVRLYAGSHILCVTSSGVAIQGEIISTKDVMRNKEVTRFLLLQLKPLGSYTLNPAPSTGDPVAVGKSLLDSIGG